MKTTRLCVGLGFDAHPLRAGRPLRLGGVTIPSRRGLVGHSDADVLLHAIIDALLGAVGGPDIGTLFPDTDPKLTNVDSRSLLTQATRRIRRQGVRIVNVDCVLVCDEPKLAPHYQCIRESVATLLKIESSSVGLKAKTCEGTALAYRSRSIAALVVALLEMPSP